MKLNNLRLQPFPFHVLIEKINLMSPVQAQNSDSGA